MAAERCARERRSGGRQHFGQQGSSVFSLTKQWSVQQLETKTEKTYINPKVLVALLINRTRDRN